MDLLASMTLSAVFANLPRYGEPKGVDDNLQRKLGRDEQQRENLEKREVGFPIDVSSAL